MELNRETDQSRPTTTARGSTAADERRRAATAKHTAAIATIEALFDRVEELHSAHRALTGIGAGAADADPIRDAEAILAAAHQLEAALKDVRKAAIAAAEHRSRNELASDVGTRPAALFPRKATGGSTVNAGTARGGSESVVNDERRPG